MKTLRGISQSDDILEIYEMSKAALDGVDLTEEEWRIVYYEDCSTFTETIVPDIRLTTEVENSKQSDLDDQEDDADE